jgi:DNA helicase IV
LADPLVAEAVAPGDLTAAEVHTLVASYDHPDFSVADVALLDELAALLGPPPRREEPDLFVDGLGLNELVTIADRLSDERVTQEDAIHSTYAHILIDEAQDVTPMQWRMLRRRGPQASWTIVGDPAQSSWPDPAETSQSVTDLVGVAPNRRFRLSTNYRSPAEVFDLAAQVITRSFPEADLPTAVRRTGVEPRLLIASADSLALTLATTVESLIRQVAGTVGVITPERWRSDIVAALAGLGVDTGRIVVTDPITVKGLEYDAVVVADPDRIIAESSGRERTLYVCLTRPTQYLVTLDVDRPGAWRPADAT